MNQPLTRAIVLLFLAYACSCAQIKKAAGQKPECGDGDKMQDTYGHLMKCGSGKWVQDEKAEKERRDWQEKDNKIRTALLFAARSRVLTTAEMKDLQERGEDIFRPACFGVCGDGVSGPDDLERRFNDLLLQQFRIRLAAEEAHLCSKEAGDK